MKKIRHCVMLSDFKNLIIKHEICGSYGQGSCKSINLETNVTTKQTLFSVRNHDKIKCFSNIDDAVKEYNNID